MTVHTSDPGLLDLAQDLRPALLRVSRQLRREAQLAGASALDAQLLNAIKKHPGIGLSELAELEQMAKPSMSSHVKRLEHAGWVAKAGPDCEDRRRVGLNLTPKGQKAMEAIRRQRNDWLAGRLAALGEAERAALKAALPALNGLAGERQ